MQLILPHNRLVKRGLDSSITIRSLHIFLSRRFRKVTYDCQLLVPSVRRRRELASKQSSSIDLFCQGSEMVNPTLSNHFPSVPQQAGTFIHRLVKKFFSITSTSQKLFAGSSRNSTHLSSMKRMRDKPINVSLRTRVLSAESHSDWNITSKSRRGRRRQRPQKIRTSNNNYPSCAACREYQQCFANPPHSVPADSLESNSNSPPVMSNNTRTIEQQYFVPVTERSVLFSKQRSLTEAQRENIGSAIELIFDTLISTYGNASFNR